jgi:hypothetical protein
MASVEQIVCERREDNIWTQVRYSNERMQGIIQYRNLSFYSSFTAVIMTNETEGTICLRNPK